MSATITTFGILHDPEPLAVDPIRVDLTDALRNPAHDPAMIDMTGLDERVRKHVLNTPGAYTILGDAVAQIEVALSEASAVDVLVYCRGGRHRSVAIGEEIAAYCTRQRIAHRIAHRDVTRQVVR